MASRYDIHEAGYDSLATAIVIQAVKDYKIARKHNDMFTVDSIQRFFRSDYCHLLCNIDGNKLITMCEAQYAKYKEERKKKMSQEEMTNKLTQLEKQTIRLKDSDNQTKYQVVSMFRYLKKLIRYQVPTPPVDVSEDGHQFECPTCGTKFDSEDTVDDFNLCYICGQRWKEERSENEGSN